MWISQNWKPACKCVTEIGARNLQLISGSYNKDKYRSEVINLMHCEQKIPVCWKNVFFKCREIYNLPFPFNTGRELFSHEQTPKTVILEKMQALGYS